ncbi:MAG: hypothetical protein ACK4UN_09505 [Limisphaerales bacterium]
MKRWFLGLLCLLQLLAVDAGFAQTTNGTAAGAAGQVYIIPIRENIMPPLVYVVRRGVKEAMEAKADAIIFDMDTNGGELIPRKKSSKS